MNYLWMYTDNYISCVTYVYVYKLIIKILWGKYWWIRWITFNSFLPILFFIQCMVSYNNVVHQFTEFPSNIALEVTQQCSIVFPMQSPVLFLVIVGNCWSHSYMGLSRGEALPIFFAAGVLLFLSVALCAFLYELLTRCLFSSKAM